MLAARLLENVKEVVMFSQGLISTMLEWPEEFPSLIVQAVPAKHLIFVFSILYGSGDGSVGLKMFRENGSANGVIIASGAMIDPLPSNSVVRNGNYYYLSFMYESNILIEMAVREMTAN